MPLLNRTFYAMTGVLKTIYGTCSGKSDTAKKQCPIIWNVYIGSSGYVRLRGSRLQDNYQVRKLEGPNLIPPKFCSV